MKLFYRLICALAIAPLAISNAGVIYIPPPEILLAGSNSVLINFSRALGSGQRDGSNFGTHLFPMSAPVKSTFVIFNTGFETLVVQPPVLEGSGAAHFQILNFGPVAQHVPGGTGLAFDIAFQAQSQGNKNADVVINSNAPGNPQAKFDVNGTATATPADSYYDLQLQQREQPTMKISKKTGAAKIKWNLLIINNGTLDADMGGIVRVHQSTDQFFGPDDPVILEKAVKKLKVGKSKKQKVKLTLPAPGGYLFAEVFILPPLRPEIERFQNITRGSLNLGEN